MRDSTFEIKTLGNGGEILIPTSTEVPETYVQRNRKKTKANMILAQKVVDYFNINESTTRKTADYFHIARSTVYRYLTEVLPNKKSLMILAKNKVERSSRGGKAAAANRKQSL